MERGALSESGRPIFLLPCEIELARTHQVFIGKNSFKAACFILVVQHHDRNDAQVLLAGMALRHFALHVLQEAIREMIQPTPAPGILLVSAAAVRPDELNASVLRT